MMSKELTSLEALEKVIKTLEAFEIIKQHKLLNYVIKNPKCAKMYILSEQDMQILKEALK